MQKIPMTAGGYQRLETELKHLKSVERPAVIRAISEAREHGDLSENAEYHAAKERQGWIETRVLELEDKLRRSEVIDVSKLSRSEEHTSELQSLMCTSYPVFCLKSKTKTI